MRINIFQNLIRTAFPYLTSHMSGTGFCPGEWFQCNITTSTVKTLPFQYTEELQPLQIY